MRIDKVRDWMIRLKRVWDALDPDVGGRGPETELGHVIREMRRHIEAEERVADALKKEKVR